jgi:hypothetical protein
MRRDVAHRSVRFPYQAGSSVAGSVARPILGPAAATARYATCPPGGSQKVSRFAGAPRPRSNFCVRETTIGGTPKQHLFYHGYMQLKCSNCRNDFELTDSEILAAAGRIRSQLRRKRAGGRPPQPHRCVWCDQEVLGLGPLRRHQAECPLSLAAQLGLG